MASLFQSISKFFNPDLRVPQDTDLIQLCAFGSQLDAEELARLLESVDVRTAVFGGNTSSVAAITDMTDGVRVMVRGVDLEEAKLVLADFEEELAKRAGH